MRSGTGSRRAGCRQANVPEKADVPETMLATAGGYSPPSGRPIIKRGSMKRFFLFYTLISLLAVSLLSAQDSSTQRADTESAVPYASRLRAAVADPRVRLSWSDAGGITGEAYEVYRAETQIIADTFDQAELIGTVEEQTETFLDVPREEGEYYYAILVRSEEGELHRTFYEYRNTTVQPVAISNIEGAEEPIAQVSGIRASLVERHVELRFTASRTGRELAVYRSTRPIDSSEALANATRVERIPSSRRSVSDFPVPGVPYYYAILDAEAPARGETVAQLGRNATSSPVEVPLMQATAQEQERADEQESARSRTREQQGEQQGEQQAGRRRIPQLEPESTARALRQRPLPLLQLQQDLQTGDVLPQTRITVPEEPQEVSEETRAAVERLFGEASRGVREEVEPTVLPPERDEEGKSAARTLTGIVQDTFLAERWSETEDLIARFLSVNPPRDVRARAYYYRAQSYYFQGKLQDALFEFLLARGEYRQEVRPWVTHVLERLHAQNATSDSPQS